MEEVFAIATPEELAELYGSEEAIAWAREHSDKDSMNADLATIWRWRGDDAKAHLYLDRIQDLDYRLSTMLGLFEIIGPE